MQYGKRMIAQEIETVSPAAREKQEQLLDRVDALLDDSRAMQESLHRNYVDIGITLIAVDDTKAWMLRAKSSDQFIKDCEDKFGKGRTVLYQCKSVARHLLPHIPADKLIEIGISKAQPLATFVKNSGKKPPAKLLAAAEDAGVGVEQFRAQIAETLHEKPESGKWFQPGGFFCTTEERKELERAYDLAARTDPPIGDVSEWMWSKEVQQRLAMEYLTTYEKELNGENVQALQSSEIAGSIQ